MIVRDIQSELLLIAKAVLFALVGVSTGAVLLTETPKFSSAALLLLCVWAFARLYYFAFYVIEHYIDDTYRYSGVLSAVTFLLRRRRDKDIYNR